MKKSESVTGAQIVRKDLFLSGVFPIQSDTNLAAAIVPQAKCPVILIDGNEQKTKPDPDNPSTVLIAKKGGKKIARGQTVTMKVRLCRRHRKRQVLPSRGPSEIEALKIGTGRERVSAPV